MQPKDGNYQHVILRGRYVEIMCEVNKEYEKFVEYENGQKILYLKLLRALYGCIESAMLWYNLFSSTLQEEGWSINEYDRCVANKIINGKQCTLVWHVDDCVSNPNQPDYLNREFMM